MFPITEFQAIKIQYFLGTDRLYIELEAAEIAETKDLDENILLDINTAGSGRAITIENASQRTGIHISQLSKLPLKKALQSTQVSRLVATRGVSDRRLKL